MRTLTSTRMLARTLPAAALIGAGVLLAGTLQASPQADDGTARHEPRAMMGGGMGMMGGGGSMMGAEGGSMMEMMSGMMGMMQQMGQMMGHCQQMMGSSGHAPTPPAQPGGPAG